MPLEFLDLQDPNWKALPHTKSWTWTLYGTWTVSRTSTLRLFSLEWANTCGREIFLRSDRVKGIANFLKGEIRGVVSTYDCISATLFPLDRNMVYRAVYLCRSVYLSFACALLIDTLTLLRLVDILFRACTKENTSVSPRDLEERSEAEDNMRLRHTLCQPRMQNLFEPRMQNLW